ncbi:Ankyrin repeat domain-containing protein 49 [Armadillidium nasatum]|uniref:Ankyrin repeat domain-containing protein 49 n=1 Tax=Armadillidium nasatum TaxID=96803 RepID=A0A5N5T7Q4_9CRUS|nr:Ankyrin repeat domain-containing protein 49 [Armadillidium nasatum]
MIVSIPIFLIYCLLRYCFQFSDHDRESPKDQILWACENGKLDFISKLLEDDPSLVNAQDSDEYTPLHRAAYSIDINAVTNSGQTALHLAATNPSAIETAQLLLMDFKIDLSIKNSVGETATDIANRCSPFAYMFSISDPVLNPYKYRG